MTNRYQKIKQNMGPGIAVHMVTGDHPSTVQTITRQVEILVIGAEADTYMKLHFPVELAYRA
jgi:magnesium-transporting ATPase (P-type)